MWGKVKKKSNSMHIQYRIFKKGQFLHFMIFLVSKLQVLLDDICLTIAQHLIVLALQFRHAP